MSPERAEAERIFWKRERTKQKKQFVWFLPFSAREHFLGCFASEAGAARALETGKRAGCFPQTAQYRAISSH